MVVNAMATRSTLNRRRNPIQTFEQERFGVWENWTPTSTLSEETERLLKTPKLMWCFQEMEKSLH